MLTCADLSVWLSDCSSDYTTEPSGLRQGKAVPVKNYLCWGVFN